MNLWIVLIIGIFIGWLFKIPFLLKWYRDLENYKIGKLKMYLRLMQSMNGVPTEERNIHELSIKYFRDTN